MTKAKELPKAHVPLNLFRLQTNRDVVRKQLADAGFEMAPEGEPGWTFREVGVAPDFHTGLASAVVVVVDHNAGIVSFEAQANG